MARFELILEQKITEKHKVIIECKDERTLLKAYDNAEASARRFSDTLDDLTSFLGEQTGIKILKVVEQYQEDWELPEYYDHRELKEVEENA